jgi:hypothetical protein
MHYALNLFINQYELWPVGYETDFSEDQQKTDELPALMTWTSFSSCP